MKYRSREARARCGEGFRQDDMYVELGVISCGYELWEASPSISARFDRC